MTTLYFIDVSGNYLGGFDGALPPSGAVEIATPPSDGRMMWSGTAWGLPLPLSISERCSSVDALQTAKLSGGITYKLKTFGCSCMSSGSIAAKLSNLERENAAVARSVTGVSLTNPVVIAAPAHGFRNLDRIDHAGIGGTIELAGTYTIGNIAADTYELTGVDGTAWTPFTSGGSATIMCEWTGIGGALNEFSAADFIALADAMNNFNGLCFRTARGHKSTISALTDVASVEAYDVSLGWPPNNY